MKRSLASGAQPRRGFGTRAPRCWETWQAKRGMTKRVPEESASHVEFAATHEKTAKGIGADKTTFMVHQSRAANRAKLPPIVFFLVGRAICLRISPNVLH